MSRRWLITVSLVAHAGIGVGLLVSGAWKLDRLDAGHQPSIGLGVMFPRGDDSAEGGHAAKAAAAPPKLEPKKKPRKVTKDLTQLTEKEKDKPEVVPAVAAASAGGNGEGEGEGEGTKTGIGTGQGDGKDCPPGAVCTGSGGGGPAAVCGNHVVEAGETCDDGNRTGGDGCSATCTAEQKPTALLPPNVMSGLRLRGDTQIHPPATVKTEMQRDGRDHVNGTVKLCLDTSGNVASATMAGSTRYPAYDAVLLAKVREWQYRPYTVNGTPMPACSAVTFRYSMR